MMRQQMCVNVGSWMEMDAELTRAPQAVSMRKV